MPGSLSFLLPTPQLHISIGGKNRNRELNVVTTSRHKEIRLMCRFNSPCPSLDIWCFTQFRLKGNKASVGGKSTDHSIVFTSCNLQSIIFWLINFSQNFVCHCWTFLDYDPCKRYILHQDLKQKFWKIVLVLILVKYCYVIHFKKKERVATLNWFHSWVVWPKFEKYWLAVSCVVRPELS